MAQELPPVEFIVVLERSIDRRKVDGLISELEDKALSHGNGSLNLRSNELDSGRINLYGTTNQTVYQALFGGEIEYNPQQEQWKVLKQATITQDFAYKGIIRHVYPTTSYGARLQAVSR